MKLNEDMQRIAANCVADVVREAMNPHLLEDGKKPPSAKALKALADKTAKAVLSGFKRISAAS